MAQQESGGTQQFNASTGLPYFGAPNGWGVLQLDPPPNSLILWNWQSNIQAAVNQLASKLAGSGGAYNFWQRQVDQWHAWNAQYPNATVPIATQDSPWNCKFWMVDDQYGSPPAGFRSFADAIWIKQYNGTGTPGFPGTGNYIAWQNPGWRLNQFDDNSRNYVYSVCYQTP
jgi:hypothetical protein